MSRIGRMPITIPAGVTVTVDHGNVVTVKGPLGQLTDTFSSHIKVSIEDNIIHVTRNSEEMAIKSDHGLSRALIENMVIGVTKGYSKIMMIVGVGYKAIKQGKDLQLFLEYSLMPGTGLPQEKYILHDEDGIVYEVPDDATIKAQGIDKLTNDKISSGLIIVVKGIDKQKVGQAAAVLRGKRPPEPYHGKGIRYIDEKVRRKAGAKKTAK